jgi:anti-anti-sigma factor
VDLLLRTTNVDGRAVLTVSGEIDLETASRLGEELQAAMRDVAPDMVVDLSAVTFMDSTGLKVLIAAQLRAGLAGGGVTLVGLRRAVRRVFEVTGVDDRFAIYATLEEALAGPTAAARAAAAPAAQDAVG